VIPVPQRSHRLSLVALVAAAGGLLPLGAWSTQGAGAATTPTSNLLVGDTATLTSGIGNWVARQGTLSRPTSGVLALKSSSSSWANVLSGTTSSATSAVPGGVYTGTISVRAARDGRQVYPVMQFVASNGTVLGKAVGQGVQDVSSTWTVTTPVVGIAPAGTATVAMGEFVAGPAVGEVHMLRSPVLSVAPTSTHDVVGPLHTSGNKLYDAQGPLVLRGIHRNGLQLANPHAITAAEVAQAKRWGANVIRLSVSSSFWLPGNCNYSSGYASTLDRAVQLVTAQKMVALVDLHTNTLVACGTPKQQVMADATADDFWRQVAARYRSNPLVAFDLYNEPHDISDDVWRNGGRIVSGGVVFTASGMQEMYDAVRSTGASNVVVVSGNDWANRLPGTLSGTNIVYGVHAYTCPFSTDPRKCSPNPLDPSPILSHYDSFSATVPVAVTEWGWPSTTDGRYATAVTSYAQSRGWGWIGFAWDGTTSGQFSLVASLDAYEPTASGMPVLAALNRSAG
jgi:endoglucanase